MGHRKPRPTEDAGSAAGRSRQPLSGRICAVPGRLLERVRELEHAPVVTVTTDDLHPHRQPTWSEPARHGDRRVGHERHVPARAHPVDVGRHRRARDAAWDTVR